MPNGPEAEPAPEVTERREPNIIKVDDQKFDRGELREATRSLEKEVARQIEQGNFDSREGQLLAYLGALEEKALGEEQVGGLKIT